jgi:hypothetical protein
MPPGIAQDRQADSHRHDEQEKEAMWPEAGGCTREFALAEISGAGAARGPGSGLGRLGAFSGH